ncbi:hypothetical protein K504DRAFT_523579 [Pleomassaria siparia CBS 279.74]|uniref:Uncharacterized protein n=1 Tax=Pleomassaria siparia CBS 279.74 TaxID=1314801 RepID=A0A6G1KD23_9PLEO|nr:hypothetical protein K504DRAFT_523579 [Pleomassaria siparia CBS 279.74]
MAEELSGFPTLVPAIITKVHIGEVNPLDIIHNGSKMTHYGTPTGSIQSVPGFEPSFKAEIDFRYKGVIKMADKVHQIFNMDPGMHTVPFGYATGSHTFLVADPELKDVENSVFVSNGRIIVHENGLTVETRQSKVIAATAMD